MKKAYFLIVFCVIVFGMAGIPIAKCYPPATTYHFDPCTAQAIIEISGIGTAGVTSTGSIDVQVSDPYDPGDGRIKIDTQIVSSNFVGTSPFGPITITGSSTAISSGAIQQQVAGNDLPADSWYYAFLEIHTTLPYPYTTIHNEAPVSLEAVIYSIPPYGTTYTQSVPDIPLLDMSGNPVGFIKYISFKLTPLPPTPEQTELYYDDGELDMGLGLGANTTIGLGVKFDHPEPGTKYRVEGAKVYIFPIFLMSPEPLRIFVYLYNPSLLVYEKVYENIANGLTSEWNVIDLKPYNIFTEQDFIIGVNGVLDDDISLGVDEDTKYHSGEFLVDETTNFIHWGYNFMIRAYVAGPYHELTVTSSPITDITFTINGTQQTTSYTEWLLEGQYTLEMPQTQYGYVWSRWLEDGDPNRIKTITLTGTTWTAVYESAPPPPVGGKATPINSIMIKPELQIPWIWLTTIVLAVSVSVAYIKRRKKQ